MIATIEIDREIAEVDGIIINCRNATIYAKVAIYSEGETMDQQIIALLTDIKTVLQQTKERDDAWLDEVRQRDKAMDKHSRQIAAKYDKWRKEDLARIQRNHEIQPISREEMLDLLKDEIDKVS